jgi:hypothetical protein
VQARRSNKRNDNHFRSQFLNLSHCPFHLHEVLLAGKSGQMAQENEEAGSTQKLAKPNRFSCLGLKTDRTNGFEISYHVD